MIFDLTHPLARIAYHEAGHAVCGGLCGCPPYSLSLAAHDHTAGRVHLSMGTEASAFQLRRNIVVDVAGAVAENIAFGTKYQPLGSDALSAWRTSTKIHGIEGDEGLIQGEVDRAMIEAERLLRQHWHVVKRIAAITAEWFHVVSLFHDQIIEGGTDHPAHLMIAASSLQ